MIKVSYNKRTNCKDGYSYNQRIRIDKETFSKLQDIVSSEIAMDFPNNLKYTFSEYQAGFLHRLYSENSVCFLTLTTLRFLKLYLKDERINVNFNSYLFVS